MKDYLIFKNQRREAFEKSGRGSIATMSRRPNELEKMREFNFNSHARGLKARRIGQFR